MPVLQQRTASHDSVAEAAIQPRLEVRCWPLEKIPKYVQETPGLADALRDARLENRDSAILYQASSDKPRYFVQTSNMDHGSATYHSMVWRFDPERKAFAVVRLNNLTREETVRYGLPDSYYSRQPWESAERYAERLEESPKVEWMNNLRPVNIFEEPQLLLLRSALAPSDDVNHSEESRLGPLKQNLRNSVYRPLFQSATFCDLIRQAVRKTETVKNALAAVPLTGSWRDNDALDNAYESVLKDWHDSKSPELRVGSALVSLLVSREDGRVYFKYGGPMTDTNGEHVVLKRKEIELIRREVVRRLNASK